MEKLIERVLEQMDEALDRQQMEKLRDVLYVTFHGVEVRACTYELQTEPQDDDLRMVQLFLASKTISGRQRSTISQYANEIRAFMAIVGKKIRDIDTMDIRWYLGILRGRGCSMATVQTRKRYLNSFWTFLQNEGYAMSNPIAKIEAMKVDKRIKKAFTAEELETIRISCGNQRDRALVEFLYATGVRVSELCSLTVGDIDLYRKEFTVIGKGNKERTCFLNDAGCFHLSRYLNWRMKAFGLSYDELKTRPLFAPMRRNAGQMTPGGVQRCLKRIQTASGVSNIHPHRFRRTYATDLLAHGMTLQDLRILMGHEKIETTLIYCEIKADSVEAAYRKHAA